MIYALQLHSCLSGSINSYFHGVYTSQSCHNKKYYLIIYRHNGGQSIGLRLVFKPSFCLYLVVGPQYSGILSHSFLIVKSESRRFLRSFQYLTNLVYDESVKMNVIANDNLRKIFITHSTDKMLFLIYKEIPKLKKNKLKKQQKNKIQLPFKDKWS